MKNIYKFLPLSAIAFAAVVGLSQTVQAADSAVGTYVDDSAITAKIKTALAGDQSLKSLEIHVDTSNGAVHLTGQVDSAAQKVDAEHVANSVSGVKAVNDDITLK